MSCIEVEKLQKFYGDFRAVDNISFNVPTGTVFGMLGPNGAGKSTTMEILIGLKKQTSGTVRILGLDPQKQPDKLKGSIGVQLQTAAMYPRLTVREILTLYASLYTNPLPVQEVMELVGLKDNAGAQTRTLSGGQRQRLALATALISNGDLLFLDEPTTGLDPQSRRTLWNVVLDSKNQGKTVFLTTHYMDEAERLCDYIIIVDHGRIIAQGSPQSLIEENFSERAVEFSTPLHWANSDLEDLTGVTRMQMEGDRVTLYTLDPANTVAALMEYVTSGNRVLEGFNVRTATLEDVFLKLTGRRIRPQ
ncbi:MAG: ABC transporter ATP-binding protein [Limnochordia bacterium]|jgi:ABC-2 type transport system ATP-binding protein|nr:ABC transporter ATP-binding protein [Limnochordia bacterium]